MIKPILEGVAQMLSDGLKSESEAQLLKVYTKCALSQIQVLIKSLDTNKESTYSGTDAPRPTLKPTTAVEPTPALKTSTRSNTEIIEDTPAAGDYEVKVDKVNRVVQEIRDTMGGKELHGGHRIKLNEQYITYNELKGCKLSASDKLMVM